MAAIIGDVEMYPTHDLIIHLSPGAVVESLTNARGVLQWTPSGCMRDQLT